MTVLLDWCGKMDWIGRQCEELLNKTERERELKESEENKSKLYAATKRYMSCQFTTNTLPELKAKVNPEMTKEEFTEPLRPIKALVSKWYFIQMKRLSQNLLDENQLHPLPSPNKCRRIMEIYYNMLSSEDLNVIEPKACKKIFEKYFSSEPKEISYSEHLIINTLMCLGSLYSRYSVLQSSHYRKDKIDFTPEKLFQIESDCYQNSLYYYHKISLVSEGLHSIQGLLLFYTYIKASVSAEAALNVFVVAIKFARDLKLSCLDNFNHLPREEFLQIRSIWLYCYLNDSALSLALSNPPIIHESDMSVSLGRNYFKTLRTSCPISNSPDGDVIQAVKSEGLLLETVKKNPWYFSVILNYYRATLCKISNKITRHLFSVDATSTMTFNEIVAKIIEIKDDLVEFSDNMPLYLVQDNQRTFLARIYHALTGTQTVVNFKLMSALITESHIKREALFVILSNFAQTFLNDNKDLIEDNSRDDCHELWRFFEMNKVKSYKATLNALKAIDFKDHTILHHKQHFLYDFFTVIISTAFYVIDNIDTSASFELLCLLKDLYYRVTSGASAEEIHVHQDVKWLLSIFLLSFLLEAASIHYKNKNTLSFSYPMDDDRYRMVMKEITTAFIRETEQVITVYNKGRSPTEKESDTVTKTDKVPKWILLKLFDVVDLPEEDSLQNWWDSKTKSEHESADIDDNSTSAAATTTISTTEEDKDSNSPDTSMKLSETKNKQNTAREYELGFNFNERWLPADMKFFGQDALSNTNSKNNFDFNFMQSSTFFEDINSSNR